MKQNQIFFSVTILLSMVLNSCNMKKSADLIVTNANIYTVDETFSKATAFAVKDGFFVAVGSDEEIKGRYKSRKILDLNNAPVYPGFQDSHGHLIYLGTTLKSVDLRGAKSFDEILERLQKYANQQERSFIIGDGWDQNHWNDPTIPDNDKLSELFPDIPVILNRIDLHALIANRKAIEMAGLKSDDKTIKKGEAFYKKNGEFSGLFMEDMMGRVEAALPVPTREETIDMLKTSQEYCFKYGLTAITDAGTEVNVLKIIDSLQDAGTMKIRIDAMIRPTKEHFDTFNKPTNNRRLRIATLKLFLDGALGSRGAQLLEPYSDDKKNSGLSVSSDEEFRANIKWAYDHGFAVSTHCIGDAANRRALDMYGEVLQGKNDLRWRIEHSQIVDEADVDKFSQYSIIPSIQPTHCTSDMLWAKDRLGKRIANAYMYKRLLNQNGWLPSGTDFPIESVNPIYTFFAAVYRKNLDFLPEDGFQMENALTKEEALKSMTIWGAKASFSEKVRGSIEVGKYADFVILDRDIMTIEEREVPNTQTLATYIAGEDCYINEAFGKKSGVYTDKEAIANILERKSVRKYTDKMVEDEKIDLMIRSAMAAPSGKDKRPWHFYVVKDRVRLDNMAEALPYAKMLKNAPVAIVICGDESVSEYWYLDCSAASQNLLLAAEALDLGAVWTAAYPYEDRMQIVSESLSLPQNIKPLVVIPVGYPQGDFKPKDKYDPDKIKILS